MFISGERSKGTRPTFINQRGSDPARNRPSLKNSQMETMRLAWVRAVTSDL